MKKILITGAGSYVGESVRKYILTTSPGEFEIDTVGTMNDEWKKADFTKYDVVYHVAGIAHVNADPKMEPLYYKINRDLTIEVAQTAKVAGVRQFIFMSSQIVFHESQSLKTEVLTNDTKENPNGFYGDSKLQAEIGLHKLETDDFKVCILRPCMIYGPNAKGNFPRLVRLATKVPVFPNWHNKRSMLYIDNLAEFVKQAVWRELRGTFYPQNREQAETVEIVRFFAKAVGHKVWITRLLNPFVWLGSFVLQPINKMFATYYYDPSMSKTDFDYQLVSFGDSLKIMAESLRCI
ncbi:NAD-dependent epimerase/dehydratase family protein [Segatella baroniae]|uniref:NAD-dependent epimerase/dehydratase family protein n=1 Tax=Segatella baroniae TaxID=305719 RepID=UPI000485DF85|nr:NAD-dependent epimerase/dehydratase family protein [Segatella baroniae]